MSFLIKKNIFSEIEGKSLQVNNIKSFFGDRVIDVLAQTPLKFLRKNLKEKLEIPDINKIITIDLKIINHVRPHNKKSPYKVIAVNKVNQKMAKAEKISYQDSGLSKRAWNELMRSFEFKEKIV